MTKYRTVWVPLFTELLMMTDNVPTTVRQRDLDVELGSLLLHAEDVALVTNTRQNTGGLEWSVGFFSGWNRGSELPVENLLGATTFIPFSPGGPQRHAPYVTTTKFLPETRLTLLVRNNAGFSAPQSAILSAGLLVKLWGV